MLVLIALIAFAVALAISPSLAKRLKDANFVGRDLHKPDKPAIPEMGGIAIVAGLAAGALATVASQSFFDLAAQVDVATVLALLGTVLMAALIGLVDDLLSIPQVVKALLPAFAAVPLIAIRAGDNVMSIPLIGMVDMSLAYPLVLIPAVVTIGANAVNMLAGFNGLEAGMGAVAMGSLAVIAWEAGEITTLAILLAGVGALLGVLPLNWYPSRVFVGDVGTLTIGALIAGSAVVGDFELAGAILLIPYAMDFVLKAANRFPSTGWGGVLGKDGKLRCPPDGPVGLCQLIMRVSGGIHERGLVLLLIAVECVLGVVAILLYVL